jgi:hypothetical protein
MTAVYPHEGRVGSFWRAWGESSCGSRPVRPLATKKSTFGFRVYDAVIFLKT